MTIANPAVAFAPTTVGRLFNLHEFATPSDGTFVATYGMNSTVFFRGFEAIGTTIGA